MRKGRFTAEQMEGILRETDRDPVAQVTRKHGIGEQTICAWRKRFSGMPADEVKRLRQPEQKNAPLPRPLQQGDLLPLASPMRPIAPQRQRASPDRPADTVADSCRAWRRRVDQVYKIR